MRLASPYEAGFARVTGIYGSLLLLTGGLSGSWFLRKAWADRQRQRGKLLLLGWGILAITTFLASAMIGPVLGLAYAATLPPLGALIVVASGVTRRTLREAKRAKLAAEPLEGPARLWRGGLKFLLAGPLGMLAAMGLAFCYASWSPGAIQTRLLIAALLVPGLWGLAMTWTLADPRLLRAAAVLAVTIILGFGMAFLGGIA